MQEDILSGSLTVVHEDERRQLSEFNSPEAGFSVQRIRVSQPSPLGNHYHRRKYETFVIVKGGGVAVLKPWGRPKQILRVSRNAVIRVTLNMGHAFVFEPGSEVLCFSSAAWNEQDPDLNPQILIRPECALALLEEHYGKMAHPACPPANT